MVLLVLATCLALLCVLVAGASGYTRFVNNFGGGVGSDAGQLRFPGGIAVSPDGSRVYVADTGNERISEYTAGGEFLRAWGWGVADGSSTLQTCRLQSEEEAENGEGEGRECLKGQAGQGEGQLNQPVAVAVDGDGTVLVLNRAKGDGRIQAFDPSGPEVEYVGALPAGYNRTGANEVSFNYPLPYSEDIAVGSDGRIYVGDESSSERRIVIFDPETGNSESVLIPEVEALAAFALSPVEPTKAEPNPEDRIWVASRYGSPYLFEHQAGEAEAKLITRAKGEGSFSGLAVDPTTGILYGEASENVNGTEERKLTEFDAESGEQLGQIPVGGIGTGNEGPTAYGLAVNPSFRYENKDDPSEEGVIYVVNRFGGTVSILAEATPGKPTVERLPAENVSSTGATVLARVNPKGIDTHAYFEYGTTTAYGLTSPAAPGTDLGDGFVNRTFSVHLYGLQPNTTYHYRLVATNADGTERTEDATFTTYPVGGPFALPDGRVYEQASTEKGTANVEGLFAARGGDGVTFASAAPLPGSASGALFTSYAALRSPAGWHTYSSSSPVEDSLEVTRAISPDLTKSVSISEKNVTGNAPPGANLYLRDNLTGEETLMTPYSRRKGYPSGMLGWSADFGRIFFYSESPLTPDTPEPKVPGQNFTSLYEWHAGTLRNVGILPGQSTPAPVAQDSFYSLHPVSEDGSKVIFLAESNPGAENGTNSNQLYARIDGNRTVQISAPEPGAKSSVQNVTFVGAATDGSAAFFKSNAQLTTDANTGAGGEREPNLYRYDLGSGDLVDLSVATSPEDEELGAAVGGVIVAPGGRSAYFVAKGKLAPGGVSGNTNLYRWTEGQGVRFVADLRGNDSLSDGVAKARVTPDGSVLAFTSGTALDPRYPGAEYSNQIYRYSAAEGSLTCVSCSPSGNGSQSSAEITSANTFAGGYAGNVLSSDGSRVFFQTFGSLVPGDTNGKIDVYEWENGSVHLISPGSGDTDSTLIDASASGDDVYFTTDKRLVPGDQDGYIDVYDAKVGGGLPQPTPAATPCEAQACRPEAGVASPPSPIGSRSLQGPGDKKAKHHRKKHKKKHHGKHKKHAKHGKRGKNKRSHGHPSVGKRG